MRIFLIGFMGSGKSFVGQQLAEILKIPFVDLDEYLEQKEGTSIAEIFEKKGEPYFRQLEKQCLHEILQFEKMIIATGGGTPCFFENMEWMKAQGMTVFLQVPIEILMKRLLPQMTHRPLLEDFLKTDSKEELKFFLGRKLAERDSFYQQAHIVYEQKKEDERVAEKLGSYLESFLF